MLKYLLVSNSIFFIGIMGLFLIRKHIIMFLFCIELIFLAISFDFIIFSVFYDDLLCQVYVIGIIILAAAESVIGLTILVLYYRLRGGISINLLKLLKK